MAEEQIISISEKVRLERERIGISQQELAEEAGISRVMVGLYERGKHAPSQLLLEALVRKGADPKFLLTSVISQPKNPQENFSAAGKIIGAQAPKKETGALIAQSPLPDKVKGALEKLLLEMSESRNDFSDDEKNLVLAYRKASPSRKRTFWALLQENENAA